MRQIIISNRARKLLAGHILSRSISISHQLADKSWEALVDDDMGYAFDCLPDPDTAIEAIVTGWTVERKCPFPIYDDDGSVAQCVRNGHCGCDES